MFINRGIYKEDAAYTYNGILLSHKRKEIMSYGETVILSEVTQKEYNKYCIFSHMCNLEK